jgi:hypothetical protein
MIFFAIFTQQTAHTCQPVSREVLKSVLSFFLLQALRTIPLDEAKGHPRRTLARKRTHRYSTQRSLCAVSFIKWQHTHKSSDFAELKKKTPSPAPGVPPAFLATHRRRESDVVRRWHDGDAGVAGIVRRRR